MKRIGDTRNENNKQCCCLDVCPSQYLPQVVHKSTRNQADGIVDSPQLYDTHVNANIQSGGNCSESNYRIVLFWNLVFAGHLLITRCLPDSSSAGCFSPACLLGGPTHQPTHISECQQYQMRSAR